MQIGRKLQVQNDKKRKRKKDQENWRKTIFSCHLYTWILFSLNFHRYVKKILEKHNQLWKTEDPLMHKENTNKNILLLGRNWVNIQAGIKNVWCLSFLQGTIDIRASWHSQFAFKWKLTVFQTPDWRIKLTLTLCEKKGWDEE